MKTIAKLALPNGFIFPTNIQLKQFNNKIKCYIGINHLQCAVKNYAWNISNKFF